jgi:hypothetical protein
MLRGQIKRCLAEFIIHLFPPPFDINNPLFDSTGIYMLKVLPFQCCWPGGDDWNFCEKEEFLSALSGFFAENNFKLISVEKPETLRYPMFVNIKPFSDIKIDSSLRNSLFPKLTGFLSRNDVLDRDTTVYQVER